MLNTNGLLFHPVINLPSHYEVYDFTKGYDPNRKRDGDYGIGRYNEDRRGMYTEEMFLKNQRTVHMGIDIAAPPETPVFVVFDGVIAFQGDNYNPQDYGPTIITQHTINGEIIYILHGHLGRSSLGLHKVGDPIERGDILGTVGTMSENGGWNPHLHFQLSRMVPTTHDLPGVVKKEEREWARHMFPDPRAILGPLYTDEQSP